MDELCTELLADGFTQLHVSDIRIDVAARTYNRTVVLHGETPTRFDYMPSTASIDPAEILVAYRGMKNATAP